MTHEKDDELAKALDITPIPRPKPITIDHDPKPVKDDDEERYKEIQQNIKDVTEVSSAAFHELAGIASASQHPRAFEVLSTLMGQIVSANKQLLELEKLREEIRKSKGEDSPRKDKVVNNNLFVGSTAEMLELLNKEKEE